MEGFRGCRFRHALACVLLICVASGQVAGQSAEAPLGEYKDHTLQATDVGDGSQCIMPAASFKFSFLDDLTRKSVPEDAFMRHANDDMDVVKAQVFLWYVYRHDGVAKNFFAKVSPRRLLERKADSINSILWLMSRSDKYFAGIEKPARTLLTKELGYWKSGYAERDGEKSLVLDLYDNPDLSAKHVASKQQKESHRDVDLLLREGVMAERSGDDLKALLRYTEVADYGYANGLVTAWLMLPRLGGRECLSRAIYYVMLSGTTGPVNWVGKDYKP